MHHIPYGALLLLVASLLPQAAAPQAPCKAASVDCAVVGEWDISVSLGAGARTNPVRGKADIPLVVIPQISYYGRRFFLENLDVGFTLYESDSTTLNLLATPGYDRVFFHRGDLQNMFVTVGGTLVATPVRTDTEAEPPRELVVHRRRTTYLVGPEWIFRHDRFIGQLDALYEATGEHDGYEVRAAIAAPIIQSESSLVISTGVTWKSAALVRYYYGVENYYEPGSALNPFVRLAYSLPLSERWTFSTFAHYERLGDAVADSPLLSEHDVTTMFAGFVYKIR